MKFAYVPLATRRPVYSLAGAQLRYRPLIPLQVNGVHGSRLFDCSLDSGADDTLFPEQLAKILGISLTGPPDEGEALPVAGRPITYAYGRISLRLSDGFEACEWETIVGFIAAPLVWPILGHAGFLQFFDVQLLGDRHEAVLIPNASFPGVTHPRPLSP